MSDSVIGMFVETDGYWNGKYIAGKVVAVKYDKDRGEFIGLIECEGCLVSTSLESARVKGSP